MNGSITTLGDDNELPRRKPILIACCASAASGAAIRLAIPAMNDRRSSMAGRYVVRGGRSSDGTRAMDLVLTEEVASKTAKHVTLRTRLARFPFVKSLETFDFSSLC